MMEEVIVELEFTNVWYNIFFVAIIINNIWTSYRRL